MPYFESTVHTKTILCPGGHRMRKLWRSFAYLIVINSLLPVFAYAVPEAYLQEFLRPVDFSCGEGVDRFFKYANSKLYPRFLSCCFVNVVDFLEVETIAGTTAASPTLRAAYYARLFETFDILLTRCRFVNSYAFLWLLEKLPLYLEPLCMESTQEAEKIVIAGARRAILEKFKVLKRDPDTFFRDMAIPIVAEWESSETISAIRDLRKQVYRFLETAINKLVWSPRENVDTWILVKNIGDRLQDLFNCGVIATVGDLNALHWKLLSQYERFIECAGSQLPESLYEAVRDDVTNGRCLWLAIDEPDKRLQTKADYLLQMTSSGVAKSLAQNQGYAVDGFAKIADQVPVELQKATVTVTSELHQESTSLPTPTTEVSASEPQEVSQRQKEIESELKTIKPEKRNKGVVTINL